MNEPAKEGGNGGKPTRTRRAKDLGIIGLITVAMQYGVGVKNEHTQKEALVDIAKQQVLQLRVEQSRIYVERDEIKDVVKTIDERLVRIEDQVSRINSKVSAMEGYMNLKHKKRKDRSILDFGDGDEYGLNDFKK